MAGLTLTSSEEPQRPRATHHPSQCEFPVSEVARSDMEGGEYGKLPEGMERPQNFAFLLDAVWTGTSGFPFASSFSAGKGLLPDVDRCSFLEADPGLIWSSGSCQPEENVGGLIDTDPGRFILGGGE